MQDKFIILSNFPIHQGGIAIELLHKKLTLLYLMSDCPVQLTHSVFNKIYNPNKTIPEFHTNIGNGIGC